MNTSAYLRDTSRSLITWAGSERSAAGSVASRMYRRGPTSEHVPCLRPVHPRTPLHRRTHFERRPPGRPLPDRAGHALWLLLLTGVRRSETLAAKWSDVDWPSFRLASLAPGSSACTASYP